MTEPAGPWHVAVDRGGTFTDVVARGPGGGVEVRKLAGGGGHGPLLEAIRAICGHTVDGPIPATAVASVRYGTTAATNALLTGEGTPCALFVTRGFGDVLRIGDQTRPDLFALDVRRAAPLTDRVVEVDERVLADGTVDLPLDESALRAAARETRSHGIDAAAVAFVHGGAHPAHEARAAAVLCEEGFTDVVASHAAVAAPRFLPRAETSTADAFLTPTLREALAGLREAFAGDVDVRFLQSHGGLSDLAHGRGPSAVLSGPAGGVVAVRALAERLGETALLGFDMGGTSTDVCRVAGEPERRSWTVAAGRRLHVPSLAIHTVAAGGGSVLGCDGRRLVVGPRSAGSDPGPAGYGRGGPATITDANAVLGRVRPERFPDCFGDDGRSPFDVDAARSAVAAIAAQAELSVEATALGCVRLANARMAQAIREISHARGHDPRDHALVAFGGAAGQHACDVARELGVRRVIVPPFGSVLSAWGLSRARPSAEGERTVLAAADAAGFDAARSSSEGLREELAAALTSQGCDPAELTSIAEATLRYLGVDAGVRVALRDGATTLAAFHERHAAEFGFARPGDAVEIVSVSVRVEGAPPSGGDVAPDVGGAPTRDATASIVCDGPDGVHAVTARLVERAALTPGDQLSGPAVVLDGRTSIWVPRGWDLEARDGGLLLLTDAEDDAAAPSAGVAVDAASLGLFAHRFMAVAERMGTVLERVSHSTNIKERLDFSCALFDARGRLLANAPHIPVHLGAMGASVRAIAANRGLDLREGDVIVTNDPYRGGSHLPDVTAVTPVAVTEGAPSFWVANRAHHADVGGITPGSMPAGSNTLEEEGVRVHGLLLVRGGELRELDAVRAFAVGPYPARAPEERLADLRAQAAANAEGARRLLALVEEHGEDTVARFADAVLDDGEAALAELLASLPDGDHVRRDALDDGTPLVLTVRIDGATATLDFTGTGTPAGGNLFAPRAVTRAAVLYALRTLVPRPIPLNEGCLRPLSFVLPEGSVLDPQPPAAVVGGNVETSMRIVDLVLGALGRAAASQGTMNNLAFGPPTRAGDPHKSAYYETLGGGTGAGPAFDGASAVQAHMTNTRITDVEVLERRWPVIVRRFAVRSGSGGDGEHRGGDGLVREIAFRAPAHVSLLTGRRTAGAPGLAGGAEGCAGRNLLIRDGRTRVLGSSADLEVETGDVLRLETPGGGGWGARTTPRI